MNKWTSRDASSHIGTSRKLGSRRAVRAAVMCDTLESRVLHDRGLSLGTGAI